MRTSLPLMYSSLNSTLSKVAPPSVERKMPRSGVGAVGMARGRRRRDGSGFLGSTSMLAIICESRRPRCVQVLPASVDLYMPSPVARSGRMMPAPEPT